MVALSKQTQAKVDLPKTGSLELLLHVLDLLPNPVYVKDTAHRWVEANAAFCNLLGRPRDGLLGLSDYDFNPPEQAEVFWAMDDEVFRSRGSNVNYEETITSEGKLLWVESRKSYFQADDGQEYLVGVLTDLTEMKAREASLAEAEKNAQAAARAKSEFLANMSHEIRTPMNGVIGMTQILRGTALSAVQGEMVDTLERSGNALLTLIDDILDFSKIEAGQLRLSAEPFALRDMVNDVATLLGTTARGKGLDLIIDFAPNLPQVIIGDAGRLRQIMMNLIGNAIKFTETGFVLVKIDGDVEGGAFLLRASVRDTGIGISADKLETIFDKFQQADNSTTRIYGGTGLGLAISRDLAEMMGGTLIAKSEMGDGTTLHLKAVLQVSKDKAGQVAPDKPRALATSMKILAVDDIDLNLDIIQGQLAQYGLNCDRANTAKSALIQLAAAYKSNQPYTLLMTDFQMPETDGLKLTLTLRRHAQFRDLPIIALSSVNDESVRDAFKAANVKDYLVKPVTLRDFERAILKTAGQLTA